MFKNRVLRRQFGPEEEEVTGNWRKLHNEELHSLCSRIIIEVNTSRRMIGEGHVEIRGGGRNIHQVYLITHTNTHTHIYILFKKSKIYKIYIKTFKTITLLCQLWCRGSHVVCCAALHSIQHGCHGTKVDKNK